MAGVGIVKNSPERTELLAQREVLVKQITELKAKPLPARDRDLHAKYRQKDLVELAAKVVAIDRKLGRT